MALIPDCILAQAISGSVQDQEGRDNCRRPLSLSREVKKTPAPPIKLEATDKTALISLAQKMTSAACSCAMGKKTTSDSRSVSH